MVSRPWEAVEGSVSEALGTDLRWYVCVQDREHRGGVGWHIGVKAKEVYVPHSFPPPPPQAPHPILLLPGCSPPPSRYSPWKSAPSWPQSNGKRTARPGGGKIPPEPEPGPPGAGQTLPLLLLLLLPPRKAIKMPLPRKDSGQGVTERGFFFFFFLKAVEFMTQKGQQTLADP